MSVDSFKRGRIPSHKWRKAGDRGRAGRRVESAKCSHNVICKMRARV